MFPQELSLQALNDFCKGCLISHLDIQFTELGTDFLQATLPVDERTKQPLGLLHGGASVVLAETMGSVASSLVIDNKKYYAVGLEVNANHIKSAKSGRVTGICRPIHIGSRSHVWDIKITNEQEQLVCISRLTMAILEIK